MKNKTSISPLLCEKYYNVIFLFYMMLETSQNFEKYNLICTDLEYVHH